MHARRHNGAKQVATKGSGASCGCGARVSRQPIRAAVHVQRHKHCKRDKLRARGLGLCGLCGMLYNISPLPVAVQLALAPLRDLAQLVEYGHGFPTIARRVQAHRESISTGLRNGDTYAPNKCSTSLFLVLNPFGPGAH